MLNMEQNSRGQRVLALGLLLHIGNGLVVYYYVAVSIVNHSPRGIERFVVKMISSAATLYSGL